MVRGYDFAPSATWLADKLADYLQVHAPNGAGSWAVLISYEYQR
jgi:hypothetical protein